MALRWNIAQAAEIRWWKSYLKDKPVEEYLDWKTEYWRKLLLELNLKLTDPKSILDAGCGPAGIFTILNDHIVTAIDPLLNKYQDLAHFDPSMYPWTRFQQQSLEELDVEHVYDVVFCLNAINHVSDISTSMNNLVRAIKPGGVLILSIDSHNYRFWKTVFRTLPGDILHPHQYDLKEYQEMVQTRGLEITASVSLKKEYLFTYHVITALK